MTRGSGHQGFLALRIAALAFSLVGCGGVSQHEDDGGSSTSGRGGGASQGGTGGGSRLPKLGLYLMLRNPQASVPELAGRACPASSGVEWDIGMSTSMGGLVSVDSPSPTDFGTTLESGTEGATVTCRVTQGGAFEIDGGGTDPAITPPSGLINFTMGGTASRSGMAATNLINFSVYTPRTFQLSSSAGFPSCYVAAVHELAPGALWASFECPALTDPARPDVACQASGTIVVEYCSTE